MLGLPSDHEVTLGGSIGCRCDSETIVASRIIGELKKDVWHTVFDAMAATMSGLAGRRMVWLTVPDRQLYAMSVTRPDLDNCHPDFGHLNGPEDCLVVA